MAIVPTVARLARRVCELARREEGGTPYATSWYMMAFGVSLATRNIIALALDFPSKLYSCLSAMAVPEAAEAAGGSSSISSSSAAAGSALHQDKEDDISAAVDKMREQVLSELLRHEFFGVLQDLTSVETPQEAATTSSRRPDDYQCAHCVCSSRGAR